ncbi:MAG: helix-turn-helix domain-containing protein [Akkermansia sp.]|nr:helix-turn-helix domain-containing protein [Akkermansia sp.]
MSMKAIDFACRLLARLNRDDMPAATRQVLLAVAAGLPEARDIARLTGMTAQVCSNLLTALERQGYIRCHDMAHRGFSLTPCGKERVASLFSFLPDRKEEA